MKEKEALEKACQVLMRHHHTLAIAESVTSGLLQNMFANVENATLFYEGGITAYNLHQKCSHLFIDPVHAVTCNCVSETVAAEMAVGISNSFKTTWGIAVTGYASPIPEENLNRLYACYAISFNKEIIRRATVSAATGTPEKVQEFYVAAIIKDFIECCNQVTLYI